MNIQLQPMFQPKILNIDTLTGDWTDNDIIMLHACFKLLTDCVENEQLLTGHIDWTQTTEMIIAKNEIEELYNWWKKRLITEQGVKNDPIYNKDQYEEDNKMLVRLIAVRQYLWT